MARWDAEYPVREDIPPAPEEFPQPRPETEYRLPDPAAEDSSPPGTDYDNPDPAMEFTPPGCGGENAAAAAQRKKRLRRLLYGAAALVLTGLLFSGGRGKAVPALVETAPQEPVYTSASDVPAPVYTSGSDIPVPVQTAASEPTPEPLGKEPWIETDFFYFSHEHHARIRLSNTGALHSVRVSVRDKTLDKPVFEYYLSEEEIAAGGCELPVLSTGDLYMENMAAYEAVNGWPDFEMTVDAWYENEAGDGEDTLTITREADPELGIGLSYMRPDFNWSEAVPSDSFYVQPWEEIEDIRYVINDPEAVRDPLTFSVDISWNGRHAAPEEYEEVLEKSEYNLVNSETGESTPHVGYTRELVLRRPDWMPEEGTLHVCIVQYLASTGEKWIREYDLVYPQRYDWEF